MSEVLGQRAAHWMQRFHAQLFQPPEMLDPLHSKELQAPTLEVEIMQWC